ncbi:uncharacterized protein METZ01_LOCUS513222 [marine metagenome]|uniref:Uncharacterized protein n=1 Tax=marine metagenome TaxID=408172 RepID=A0A383EWA4_9ZZZZ
MARGEKATESTVVFSVSSIVKYPSALLADLRHNPLCAAIGLDLLDTAPDDMQSVGRCNDE